MGRWRNRGELFRGEVGLPQKIFRGTLPFLGGEKKQEMRKRKKRKEERRTRKQNGVEPGLGESSELSE